MARSLSHAKLVVASVADHVSLSISRRGYAAAPHGVVSARGGSRSHMMEKMDVRTAIQEEAGASTAWAPDPVTGYYRPENSLAQIDAADLRAMLLNHKVRPN
ncbi:hypothetical protein Patl1_25036 [Pistacia atlantica]|uniref:Uncharacterized protein n=1 Tax=Pistacia atlantica TaxID=434234 RepID=A0ACC1B4L4_9ROSI|nr:hypothetical protein Patl1_25036 [Pistacia atlantica]